MFVEITVPRLYVDYVVNYMYNISLGKPIR